MRFGDASTGRRRTDEYVVFGRLLERGPLGRSSWHRRFGSPGFLASSAGGLLLGGVLDDLACTFSLGKGVSCSAPAGVTSPEKGSDSW